MAASCGSRERWVSGGVTGTSTACVRLDSASGVYGAVGGGGVRRRLAGLGPAPKFHLWDQPDGQEGERGDRYRD
jgi:hypothetical protein